MKTRSFFVQGKPRTKGSTRSFKHAKTGAMITQNASEHTAPWQSEISWAALEHWGALPTMGPFTVTTKFIFARPKGHFTTKGALKKSAPAFPITKSSGDLDKLERCVFDALTGICYRDDAQVVESYPSKRFCDSTRPVPGVEITVTEL